VYQSVTDINMEGKQSGGSNFLVSKKNGIKIPIIISTSIHQNLISRHVPDSFFCHR